MPDKLNHITEEQLVAINKAVGENGIVVNKANLEFVVLKVQRSKTLTKAASELLYGIATKHPLIDGNKRTALNSLLYLLEINNRRIEPTDENKSFVVRLIYNIVTNELGAGSVEKELSKVII